MKYFEKQASLKSSVKVLKSKAFKKLVSTKVGRNLVDLERFAAATSPNFKKFIVGTIPVPGVPTDLLAAGYLGQAAIGKQLIKTPRILNYLTSSARAIAS